MFSDGAKTTVRLRPVMGIVVTDSEFNADYDLFDYGSIGQVSCAGRNIDPARELIAKSKNKLLAK